jgi:hypothetical protein
MRQETFNCNGHGLQIGERIWVVSDLRKRDSDKPNIVRHAYEVVRATQDAMVAEQVVVAPDVKLPEYEAIYSMAPTRLKRIDS